MKPEPTTNPSTTGTTVEYQVRFATGPKGRKPMRAAEVPPPPVTLPPRLVAPVALPPQAIARRFPESTTASDAVVPEQLDTRAAAAPRVPKVTLLLVLGHHFERLVRDGVVKDYAALARMTGMARARITQIVNLTLLAPEIQEKILAPTERECLVERVLRKLCASPSWSLQKKYCQ